MNMMDYEPITFEEFTAKKSLTPRYDGFFNYFSLGGVVSHVREEAHFLRFMEEHSSLEKRLTGAINNSNNRSEEAKSHECDLYKAYLIMKGYGVSDEDLLIGSE